VKSGGSIKTKTFSQVFDEWEQASKTLGPTRQGGSWNTTIERLKKTALPFFGTKRIDMISASDFADYWIWRKNNFRKKKPSNGTIKRERTCLLPMFKFAVSRGYITNVPKSDPPKAKLERRPTFSLDEWQTIYQAARKWVEEGQRLATGRDRFVAWQYFLILANTGMRVGELRNLRWKDLRTVKAGDETRLVAQVQGKTGYRETVFQAGSEVFLKRLYTLRREELDKDPDQIEHVICHKNGTPIQSIKKAFFSLLKFAKVPEEYMGGKRTIYSLRHFYATQRLSHETSPFLLAKQMGTSVEMLEKFYGQTINSKLAAEITKGNQTMGGETEKEFPFD
jgi:integrase